MCASPGSGALSAECTAGPISSEMFFVFLGGGGRKRRSIAGLPGKQGRRRTDGRRRSFENTALSAGGAAKQVANAAPKTPPC